MFNIDFGRPKNDADLADRNKYSMMMILLCCVLVIIKYYFHFTGRQLNLKDNFYAAVLIGFSTYSLTLLSLSLLVHNGTFIYTTSWSRFMLIAVLFPFLSVFFMHFKPLSVVAEGLLVYMAFLYIRHFNRKKNKNFLDVFKLLSLICLFLIYSEWIAGNFFTINDHGWILRSMIIVTLITTFLFIMQAWRTGMLFAPVNIVPVKDKEE